MYVALVDAADKVACITLAFGINKRFKDRIAGQHARAATSCSSCSRSGT